MSLTISQAKQYGFVFEGARDWNTPENRARIVQDAALATQPNTAVPVEFAAYIDPIVIEILTAPRNARRLFREEKRGTGRPLMPSSASPKWWAAPRNTATMPTASRPT